MPKKKDFLTPAEAIKVADDFQKLPKAVKDHGRKVLKAAASVRSPGKKEASQGHAIHVWRWEDAPLAFKKLSPHGGDEDWVALVPVEMANEYIAWMESGSPFGCCDVSSHVLEGGCIVRIGAHA